MKYILTNDGTFPFAAAFAARYDMKSMKSNLTTIDLANSLILNTYSNPKCFWGETYGDNPNYLITGLNSLSVSDILTEFRMNDVVDLRDLGVDGDLSGKVGEGSVKTDTAVYRFETDIFDNLANFKEDEEDEENGESEETTTPFDFLGAVARVIDEQDTASDEDDDLDDMDYTDSELQKEQDAYEDAYDDPDEDYLDDEEEEL